MTEEVGLPLAIVLLVIGLALLVVGSDALVRGAAMLARRIGISEFVVGVTIVAFGTSAPELFASGGAVLQGQTEIAIGNVIGSNIANILLILGAGGLMVPMVMQRGVRLVEIPVMAGITLAGWAMLLDGRVSRIEGAVLVVGLAVYIYSVVRRGKIDVGEEVPEVSGRVSRDLLLLAGGMAGLAVGGRALVLGAVSVAESAGVPSGIIGATVIAFGTSLPELAATTRAALARKSDIAVGNIIGSNVFNLLCVMGICALLRPLGMPGEMSVHLHTMAAVTLGLVGYGLVRAVIGRTEGAIFLACYLGYVGYLVYTIVADG
ncbi:MAG: calcium/sodium antiporter [Planctomycetota bacterium]